MAANRQVDPLRPNDRERELNERYIARERRKVLGIILVLIMIVAFAFWRFAATISWNAR